MLMRLLPMARPARRDTVFGAALLMLAAGVEVLQPWPIKWLVDYVFGAVSVPEFLHNAVPFLGKGNVGASILFVCGAIVVLAIVHKALTLLSQLLLIRAGNTLVRELRTRLCEHLHALHIAYFDKTKVGDSLYRLAYDTTCVQSLLSQAIAPAATGVLVLLGVAAVMLAIDPPLTIVALLVAPAYWAVIKLFGRLMGKRAKAYHENEAALVSAATESLSSIRAVQAFTREELVNAQFAQLAGKSFKASQRLVFSQLAFSAAIGLAMALGTAGVVYLGATRVAAGRLTVGDVLVFLAYLAMLYQPMNAFSQSTSVVQSVKTQLARVFELFDIAPAVAAPADAQTPATVRGKVEFTGVSFAYEKDQPVLHDIALTVHPGQVVALVGRTGAGKSTLASLLLRFYDPTAGHIQLDGRDMRELPLKWLRQQVAIVLQEPILFSATIRDNIAFATPGATDEQVRQAARLAQADEFITQLPDGYDTMLGERGVNLSGGQRQRLGIARAFLKDAPILILDEPTSALDAHTEESLVDAIRVLAKGRTTFIIAHRLSTIRLADTIVVLDHGKIIEQGTPRDLMASDTAYRRLHRAQWGTKNEAVAV